MIPFNKPPFLGGEIDYIKEAIGNRKISGDGEFTKKCSLWLEKKYVTNKVLLTTSGTHALEMASLLANIEVGDEIIMPSYTFVSTANAFVLRGARIVFVDIKSDTLNIDENLIEAAITSRTKAIVPVHYAGVGCEMDAINEIAHAYHLKVIEDAAQGVNAYYKGKALGTLGDFGCYSFHETKNYSMGEGGALLIKNHQDIERAEIIREKGTNRSQFFRGEIDKYTWVDCGSSYLPSELNAAYLYAQLEQVEIINQERIKLWETYHKGLKSLEERGYLQRPVVPEHCQHNGHMYAIRVADLEQRTALLAYLKQKQIGAVFHYVPLHTAVAGKRLGRFSGIDRYTTKESNRLIRLPMYYGLKLNQVDEVITQINNFFKLI